MATKQSVESPTLQELTVVDADSHLQPSPKETLVEYIDRGNAARRMIETSDNLDADVFTDTRASPAFPNDGDYDGTRAGYDPNVPADKLGFMEKFGLDYSLLTPPKTLATINHDGTAVALASAYNAWLREHWLDVDERLRATLLVAHQVPDRAAEEVDRMAGEDRIAGVQLPGSGLVPPAGHRWHYPVYEAATDHGLPVVIHSHDLGATNTFPVQRQWAETFTESHAFTFPAESIWHLISLICQGVVERFPDLEFVLQEPGFEWVPWMMWRLDDHYLQNSQDLPTLTKRPSEYIREQFHFTTQPLGHTEDHGHMGSMMEMARAGETLLFSTDHPHPDFDTPEEVFTPARTRLDGDDLRSLMGGTAIDLFGFE